MRLQSSAYMQFSRIYLGRRHTHNRGWDIRCVCVHTYIYVCVRVSLPLVPRRHPSLSQCRSCVFPLSLSPSLSLLLLYPSCIPPSLTALSGTAAARAVIDAGVCEHRVARCKDWALLTCARDFMGRTTRMSLSPEGLCFDDGRILWTLIKIEIKINRAFCFFLQLKPLMKSMKAI